MVTRPTSCACRRASGRPSATNRGSILSARDASRACRPASLQPRRYRRGQRGAHILRVDTPPCCRTRAGEAPLRQTREYKRVRDENDRFFTDSPMKRPKVEKRSRWTGHPPCGGTIGRFLALSGCPIQFPDSPKGQGGKKSPTTKDWICTPIAAPRRESIFEKKKVAPRLDGNPCPGRRGSNNNIL